jgi:hypothetical protein
MVVRCSEIPCFMCSAQKCGGLGRVRERRDIPKTRRDCGENSELYCGEMCLKRSECGALACSKGKFKCLRMGTRNSVHSKTEDLLVAGVRCVQAEKRQEVPGCDEEQAISSAVLYNQSHKTHGETQGEKERAKSGQSRLLNFAPNEPEIKIKSSESAVARCG